MMILVPRESIVSNPRIKAPAAQKKKVSQTADGEMTSKEAIAVLLDAHMKGYVVDVESNKTTRPAVTYLGCRKTGDRIGHSQPVSFAEPFRQPLFGRNAIFRDSLGAGPCKKAASNPRNLLDIAYLQRAYANSIVPIAPQTVGAECTVARHRSQPCRPPVRC